MGINYLDTNEPYYAYTLLLNNINERKINCNVSIPRGSVLIRMFVPPSKLKMKHPYEPPLLYCECC